MKKFYILIVLTATVAAGAFAEYKTGYYDKMNGKSTAALKAAAKECVSAHTKLDYTNLPNYWQYTDVYPELVNGLKRWWDMYSDKEYLIQNGMDGLASFRAHAMQREHSVPKSWWKDNNVEYTPCYSDLWNLFPSDGTANNRKSNYPLGYTAPDPRFDNGVTKVGIPKDGYGDGAYNVFEPADRYKGDFARAYMYVATVYDDINWNPAYNQGYPCNTMIEKNAYPTFTEWSINMLLEWSRQDPVDEKEIRRNDEVEKYQNNRNPFVDFPELAEFIWGARTSQVFNVSEQQGLTPTKPGAAVEEIVSPQTMRIIPAEGGIRITVSGAASPIHVYDISGREVLYVAEPADGAFYALPRAVYIVTAAGIQPLKIAL